MSSEKVVESGGVEEVSLAQTHETVADNVNSQVEDVIDQTNNLNLHDAPKKAKDESEEAQKEEKEKDASSEKKKKRAEYLTRMMNKALFYLQTHILVNPKAMEKLSKVHKLFTFDERKGVWFVIMSAENAIRFIDSVDQYLVRSPIHKSFYKNNTPLFEWDDYVFFCTREAVQSYLQMSVLLGEDTNSDVKKELMRNYKVFEAMSGEEIKQMVDKMDNCNKEEQIAITFMCVDREDFSGSVSFYVNLKKVLRDDYNHFKQVADRYFMDMRLSETLLSIKLRLTTILSEDERNLFMSVSFRYANAIMLMNKLTNISKTSMKRLITAEEAPCGYCSKAHANVRCKNCYLFRYCNEECRELHAKNGVEGAKETQGEGQYTLTHEDACLLARALTTLWMQMPENITDKEYDEIMARSLAEFHKLATDEASLSVEEKTE